MYTMPLQTRLVLVMGIDIQRPRGLTGMLMVALTLARRLSSVRLSMVLRVSKVLRRLGILLLSFPIAVLRSKSSHSASADKIGRCASGRSCMIGGLEMFVPERKVLPTVL
jgi:hypothetical protein